MKVLQLLWGGLIVIGFLLSGVYMSHVIDPDDDLSLISMTYRANHIYWLMSGLVVIAWAQRSRGCESSLCLWVNRVAGLMICVAPVILAAGFILDAGNLESDRLWTFYGVILVFAGIVLSFLSTLIETLVARQIR